jgi:hypothetical protein
MSLKNDWELGLRLLNNKLIFILFLLSMIVFIFNIYIIHNILDIILQNI